MSFLEYAWLIPALPLLGFLIITLTPIRRSGQASGWLATALMACSALMALGVAFALPHPQHAAEAGGFAMPEAAITHVFRWAPAGAGAPVTMGFTVDGAVALMLAMVAVVSACIHLFSIGYMAHDERQGRFFSFISLFTSAMLLMLLASNLLLFFMAWEIMGLCSYLLIGFWYDRSYANPAQITPRQAAIKAFITTRIGDVLLMLGLVYLWWQAGSMDFGTGAGQIYSPEFLAKIATTPTALGISTATAIALLIFCGTVGKAAQFPLHVWLPDAMEGPTPVSALIHAATMVAAGVFLVARTYPIFLVSGALPVVAAIGAITALGAALIACTQFDIKRILAYSTVSQLGFMVAALGVGGWMAALFHLLTHAFFKALLFLGSGSVIHGMEHAVGHDPNASQDIRLMGGLRRLMPVTFWTYMAGYLALIGFPGFAGFWSKDEILAEAFGAGSYGVGAVLLLAAFLTAFYMTRQVLLVFFGEFRGDGHGDHRPHESPWTMLAPLAVLAAFAVLGGFSNTPFFHGLASYLGQEGGELNLVAMALAVLATLAGMGAGYALYRSAAAAQAEPLEPMFGGGFTFFNRRMQVDELYAATFGRLTAALARAFRWLDDALLMPLVVLIDRAGQLFGRLAFLVDDAGFNDGVDAASRGTVGVGDRLRKTETGIAQDYGAMLFGGVVVLGIIVLYAFR
ncbi:NADH-quinone oxidoreductase subunit L [Chloroflexia bacterium SDU3-3]|nr:NADH-quinone oxidoreductase subunit L [Chloroflexia bacterium SDU3-3]